jgi:hypothetical protein
MMICKTLYHRDEGCEISKVEGSKFNVPDFGLPLSACIGVPFDKLRTGIGG